MKTHIQQNVKYLRVSNRRTKIWVASQIGKTETAIRSYETGKSTPPVTVLQQYAELFGVTVGDIVDRDLSLSDDANVLAEGDPVYQTGPSLMQLVRQKELIGEELSNHVTAIDQLYHLIEQDAAQMAQFEAQYPELAARLKRLLDR